MTDFFKKYALRNSAILEVDDAKFELRPMSQANRDFFISWRIAQAEIEKLHKEGTRERAIAEDDAMIEVAVKTLIVGWNGLELDGSSYRFTLDNAEQLFRQVRSLYNQIIGFCCNEDNFRDTEADKKKSAS